jgi:hypothetical protein
MTGTYLLFFIRYIFCILSLFGKNKDTFTRRLCCVCVSVYTSCINFPVPEQVFMKLGMHIMAHEPISVANFINPFNQSIFMCIPLSLLGKGSVKTLSRQRIYTQEWNNCLTRRFLCGPCLINGMQVISPSQNFLLLLPFYLLLSFLSLANFSLESVSVTANFF